jgi:hypothetical protein
VEVSRSRFFLQRLSHGAKFRANPCYELFPYSRLEMAEQTARSDVAADPDAYGLLRPIPGSSLPILSVCRETALIFLTLREPGPLPGYAESVFRLGDGRELKRLIFDRILEVTESEHYVSGPEACVHLGLDTSLGIGRLARLSHAALRYGQALELKDPSALSLRLYLYNQQPASADWRRRLSRGLSAAEFLGIASGGSNERALRRAWRSVKGPEGWHFFTAQTPKPHHAARSPCKLYVSPRAEALPEALRAAIETLASTEAQQFKLGADLYGILRPDKLVAYFPSKEGLLAALEALRSRLEGMPVQGVPFTAEVAGGLLSWGVDPTHADAVTGYSWRQWITNRLAVTIIAAQDAAGGTQEPWRFALERIRLEGVDPQTFSPTSEWTEAQRK